jgi:hypothetical protein
MHMCQWLHCSSLLAYEQNRVPAKLPQWHRLQLNHQNLRVPQRPIFQQQRVRQLPTVAVVEQPETTVLVSLQHDPGNRWDMFGVSLQCDNRQQREVRALPSQLCVQPSQRVLPVPARLCREWRHLPRTERCAVLAVRGSRTTECHECR